MKRITSLVVKSLVTILIGSGALAANLRAQTDLAMTARIPFTFTVGTESIPAGTYRFSLESSPFLLSIVDVKTGDKKLFPVRPDQQRESESHGRLIFRESDGGSVLNQVHFLGTRMFPEVIQGRDRGRMEAKKSSAGTITVAQR